MIAARIPGATRRLAEHQDEYHALSIRDADVGGFPVMQSLWQPTPSEARVLAQGGAVRLSIGGRRHPPVMVEAVARSEAGASEANLAAQALRAAHAAYVATNDPGEAFVALMTSAVIAGRLINRSDDELANVFEEVKSVAATLLRSLDVGAVPGGASGFDRLPSLADVMDEGCQG